MTFTQLALAPPPPRTVMVPKQAVLDLADRLWAEGKQASATAVLSRAAAVRDNESVPFQPDLARRYGLVSD